MIRRAKKILEKLEEERPPFQSDKNPQKSEEEIVPECDMMALLQNSAANEIAERLEKLDLNILTPIEAMNILFELKKLL